MPLVSVGAGVAGVAGGAKFKFADGGGADGGKFEIVRL